MSMSSPHRIPINCKDLDESTCKSNNVACEYYFDATTEEGSCIPRPDNLISHIEKGSIPEVIRTLEVVSGKKNIKEVFMKIVDLSSKLWVSGVAEKLLLFNRNIGNPANRRYGNPMGEKTPWTKEMVTSLLDEFKDDGMCTPSDCSMCFSSLNEHKDPSKIVQSKCCGHMEVSECNTEEFETCIGCHRSKSKIKQLDKKHLDELLEFMLTLPRSEKNITLGSSIMQELDKYKVYAGSATELVNRLNLERNLEEEIALDREHWEREDQLDQELIDELRRGVDGLRLEPTLFDHFLLGLIVFSISLAGVSLIWILEKSIPDINAKFGWEVTVVIISITMITKILHEELA